MNLGNISQDSKNLIQIQNELHLTPHEGGGLNARSIEVSTVDNGQTITFFNILEPNEATIIIDRCIEFDNGSYQILVNLRQLNKTFNKFINNVWIHKRMLDEYNACQQRFFNFFQCLENGIPAFLTITLQKALIFYFYAIDKTNEAFIAYKKTFEEELNEYISLWQEGGFKNNFDYENREILSFQISNNEIIFDSKDRYQSYILFQFLKRYVWDQQFIEHINQYRDFYPCYFFTRYKLFQIVQDIIYLIIDKFLERYSIIGGLPEVISMLDNISTKMTAIEILVKLRVLIPEEIKKQYLPKIIDILNSVDVSSLKNSFFINHYGMFSYILDILVDVMDCKIISTDIAEQLWPMLVLLINRPESYIVNPAKRLMSNIAKYNFVSSEMIQTSISLIEPISSSYIPCVANPSKMDLLNDFAQLNLIPKEINPQLLSKFISLLDGAFKESITLLNDTGILPDRRTKCINHVYNEIITIVKYINNFIDEIPLEVAEKLFAIVIQIKEHFEKNIREKKYFCYLTERSVYIFPEEEKLLLLEIKQQIQYLLDNFPKVTVSLTIEECLNLNFDETFSRYIFLSYNNLKIKLLVEDIDKLWDRSDFFSISNEKYKDRIKELHISDKCSISIRARSSYYNLKCFPNLSYLTIDTFKRYIHLSLPNSLEYFEIGRLEYNAALELEGSLDNLKEFRIGSMYHKTTLRILSKLDNLEIFAIQTQLFSSASIFLPDSLPSLKILILGRIFGILHNNLRLEPFSRVTVLKIDEIYPKAIVLLPDSFKNLETLVINDIPEGAMLQLPTSLNNLTTLTLGNLNSTSINLPIPLNELKTFTVNDVHDEIFEKLLESLPQSDLLFDKLPPITIAFSDLIPSHLKYAFLSKYKCKIILKIENDDELRSLNSLLEHQSEINFTNKIITLDLGKINVNVTTIDDLNNLWSSLFSDNSSNICHGLILGDIHAGAFELPDLFTNIRNLTIGTIHHLGKLIVPKQLPHLTTLETGWLGNEAILELPNELPNLTEFTCSISPWGNPVLPNSLPRLKNCYVKAIQHNAILTMPNLLNNLITLTIGDIGYGATLILLSSLNSLETFTIGNIKPGATLKLPQTFYNLQNLTFGTVEDENTRIQLHALSNSIELNKLHNK